jgi:peptide/nickel transport system permease protein
MRFILRRLGFYLIAFFVALTINFFLPRLIPGDPATAIVGSAQACRSRRSSSPPCARRWG